MSSAGFVSGAVPWNRCSVRSGYVGRRPLTFMAAKGFGSGKPEPREPSEGSKKRDAAAERLEKMRGENAPEYSIWLRINSIEKESEGEADFPWLPVGSMTIPRGESLSKAIFNEDVFADLMSGANKLFPNLKDYDQDSIDVGYKMKDEEDDEEIRLAARPTQNFFTNLVGKFRRS